MRISVLLAALMMVAAFSVGSARSLNNAEEKTVVGYIGDSMCGLDHSSMKMGDDKTCTVKCVEAGAKFILADREKKIVYTLDSAAQEKARDFAGKKVKVTGQVDAKAKTIQVTKIEAAA